MELEEINELEISLGVDVGFFDSILDEDDWSFVIKLHALIEAATGHLLVEHFDDQRLAEVISFLELSNQKTGKVAFLRAMELISSDYKRFIMSFSELRNSLVHNISSVKFSFKKMVGSYSEKELTNFMKRYGLFLKEQDLQDLFHRSSARDEPKNFIYFSALAFLTYVYNRKRTSYYERVVKAVKLANEDSC